MQPKTRDSIKPLLLVFALALAIRAVYFFQLKASPFFLPVGNNLDPHLYLEWGRYIAAGDWIGSGPYLGMPLYAYCLGVFFKLFGSGAPLVIAAQLFISALNCALIFLIAKRLFDTRVAVIAGVIGALYLPFLFNDGMITSSALITALNYSALYLFLRFEKNMSWLHLALAAVTLGLATLARASTLLFLPCIVLWIAAGFAKLSLNKKLGLSFLLCASFAFVILPVTIRNYVVMKERILITPYGGVNFYIGNNPWATGFYRPFETTRNDSAGLIEDSRKLAEKETGKELSLREASDFFVGRAMDFIRNTPGKFAILFGRKVLYFWNHYEVPDVLNYYFVKRFVPILRLPLFSFLVIGPLGILGIFLSLSRRRDLTLAYLFLGSYIFSISLFFINARYRITIVPIVIIFAAFFLNELVLRVKEKNYGLLLKCVPVLALALAVSHLPIKRVDYATSYSNLGLVLSRQGKTEEAKGAFLKALSIRPDFPSAYNNLGTVYYNEGNKAKAKEYFVRAESYMPENPIYAHNVRKVSDAAIKAETAEDYVNLGNSYLRRNMPDEAMVEYAKALELDANIPLLRYNLGILYFKKGDYKSARKEWETSLKLDPGLDAAKKALNELP